MPRDPFREDFQNPNADPLVDSVEQFDMDEVCRRIDGDHGPDSSRMVEALGVIIGWLVENHDQPRNKRPKLAAKVLAFAWVIRPDLLGGKSLAQIARDHGCSVDSIHRCAASFGDRFGIRNRAQIRHGWNFTPSGSPSPIASIEHPTKKGGGHVPR